MSATSQPYEVSVTGATFSKASTVFAHPVPTSQPGEIARVTLRLIARHDPLHAEEITTRVLDFWTVEQIEEDLASCGRCDILVCGGHYTVSVTKREQVAA